MIADVWAQIWSRYLLHAEGEDLNQVVCCFVMLHIKRQNDLTCHSQFHMPLQPTYSGQWVSGEETWTADTVPVLAFRTFLSQAYHRQTVILHISTTVSITNNTCIVTYPSKHRTRHARWAEAWFSDSVVVFISMLQFGQRIKAGLGPTGKGWATITGRQSCKNNTFSQYHCVSTFDRYY